MALGAPRPAKPAIANPGWNALPGRVMGGGCQGNKSAAQYAQAVPPSRNAGAMYVLEQRAYFSAWRRVLERPSVMSAMRVLPWGVTVGGFVVKLFSADTRALGP